MIDLDRAAASLYGPAPAPAAPKPSPTLAALTGERVAAPAAPVARAPGESAPEPVSASAILYDNSVELAGATPSLDEPDYGSASEIPADLGLGSLAEYVDQAELAEVRQAVFASGLGYTTGSALMDAARQALRANGGQPLSESQLQASRQKCEAALRAEWGGRYESNLAKARAVVEKAGAVSPVLVDFLVETGMANDPKVIKLLAARATRRPGAQG